jgi:tRNA pseudouridine55 synthase
MNEICGIINIYKEKGYTSHDVVNVVRKYLNRVKTGHTGTLDPDAEGVLPICVGKATKLADYIAADTKQYRAVLRLGMTTTTEDTSGDVLTECEVTSDEKSVREAIMSFVGECEQKPPMYSAIKVNGKKLYEYARAGVEVERKTRSITIFSISDIKKIAHNIYEFTVDCSKGTYIRTLCHDIGENLGCGGCMAELTRTRSGRFSVENSIRLDELKTIVDEGSLDTVLMTMDTALSGYSRVIADEACDKLLRNGNPLRLDAVKSDEVVNDGDKVVMCDYNNNIIGVYIRLGALFKPVTMLI